MKKIAYISGGIGGAKLAKGLYALEDIHLSIIVNTGDDENIHGIKLSPDIDSVMYALAGMEGEFGWGQKNDTFNVSNFYKEYQNQQFSIGDKDMALKLFRNQMLNDGKNLTEVTKFFTDFYKLDCQILPMTNEVVSTTVTTLDNEVLSFQEYFVERKAEPVLKNIEYIGANEAFPTNEVTNALLEANKIIIGPSNPLLSIGPILSISKIKKIISEHRSVTVVSPFINQKALKGPSGRNFTDFGLQPNIQGLQEFYGDIANKFIVHKNENTDENTDENTEAENILFSDKTIADNLAKEITK